ncbi:heparanase [Elysia marginata]|uniref:Heparanase n=1 Tax=Elysia marginata TaxID=1093978 RepID=A0AAV4IB58_9GAST|nr:heparanase [Elysia marginata]
MNDLLKSLLWPTGEQWNNISDLFHLVGWEMCWNFNIMPRAADGGWDTSNAKRLLLYAAARFLSEGCQFLTEVGIHHYYLRHDAEEGDFTKVKVMEGLRIHLKFAKYLVWRYCDAPKPISLTETSTATGGGVQKVSNAFAAGFLWLDKLGLCALYGIHRVFRQSFFAASYALITKNLRPNPDYYLSVLYKRLVLGPVFSVNIKNLSPLVRVYANCANPSYYGYKPGALVVYYLNLAESKSSLSLRQFQSNRTRGPPKVDLYILQAADGWKNMQSRNMNLNGELIAMEGEKVPALRPQRHKGDVTLKPRSYGFIVMNNARVARCRCYHRAGDKTKISR